MQTKEAINACVRIAYSEVMTADQLDKKESWAPDKGNELIRRQIDAKK